MLTATVNTDAPSTIPPLAHLSYCHRVLDKSIRTLQHFLGWTNGGTLAALDAIDVRVALKRLETVSRLHREDEESSLFPRLYATDRPEASRVRLAIDSLQESNREGEGLHIEVDRLVHLWLEQPSLSFQDTWRLQELLRELRKFYAQHAQIEESQVFPAAEQVLCENCMQSVTMEMLTRRGFSE